jgi:hypothetical protein
VSLTVGAYARWRSWKPTAQLVPGAATTPTWFAVQKSADHHQALWLLWPIRRTPWLLLADPLRRVQKDLRLVWHRNSRMSYVAVQTQASLDTQ